MKELSIEEKAKAYDEAIERARMWRNKSGMPINKMGILDDIFPNLMESEDEKIRKSIINLVIKSAQNGGMALHKWESQQMLAWLEKKKSNPYTGAGFKYNGQTWGMCARDEGVDILVDSKLISHIDIRQGEQKPADKIEPKFKVGDIITPKDRGHEPWQIMQVDILDKKYRFKNDYVIHFSQEEDYELVEHKLAWSEEDNEYIKSIISTIECSKAQFPNSPAVLEAYNSDLIWLKSLKDRCTWKPSEEHIEALDHYVNDFIDKTSDYAGILKGLLEQLKAL